MTISGGALTHTSMKPMKMMSMAMPMMPVIRFVMSSTLRFALAQPSGTLP